MDIFDIPAKKKCIAFTFGIVFNLYRMYLYMGIVGVHNILCKCVYIQEVFNISS